MSNINTDIYDRKVHRSAMVRVFEDKVTKDLLVEFDDHIWRLDELIRSSKVRENFPKKFYEALDKELIRTFGNAKNLSEKHLISLVQDQTSFTSNIFQDTIKDVWRVKRPERRIAEEIVLKKPLYKNTTLSQGWSHISLNEKRRLENVIRLGLSKGLDENQIADSILKSNFHNVTKQQAIGLARTGITSVIAQTDHEVYDANKDALQGWQYVAVLDSRTTPLCAHRDGTVYPITDTEHLPPAHWHCRSTTIPVVKSYDQLSELEGIAQIRKRNLSTLSSKQIAYYDGQTPLKESYSEWLLRQPTEIQLKHLGNYEKLELFRSGQLPLEKFTNHNGDSVGIKKLRRLSESGYSIPGDSTKFALAKEKLDTLKLGATRVDDFYESNDLKKVLKEYYILQTKELNGTLALTNYRGINIGNKKLTRQRVLASPPNETNLRYNPLTGKYDDARMYQPRPDVLQDSLRRVRENTSLKDIDKEFIIKFVEDIEHDIGVNESAVVAENLRIVFSRFRDNKEPWSNLKAVFQSQVKFDVMNISDSIETRLRQDANFLKKLKESSFIDPVLGPTELQRLSDNLVKTIKSVNRWEDSTALSIANELRNILDIKIAKYDPFVWNRLDDTQLRDFYLRFAKRLSLNNSPDRDQLAVSLGRDLYNLANYRGTKRQWYELGLKILDDAKDKGFYVLDTYGVQKRRMKSKLGNHYFGPYYDTEMVFLRITDKRILNYAKSVRELDVGLRLGVVNNEKNKLYFRKGYKTYFLKDGIGGWYDTRIPITSTDSFSGFPADLIDDEMVKALNWAANTQYKIDPEYHDFIRKLLDFHDDKGKSKFYDDLNVFRQYIVSRGDSYERFKTMEWLRQQDAAFSNHPFLDHRARIYERGFIGPQAGETFRPFLNTVEYKNFSEQGFLNFKDQIGGFLGGLSDELEGSYNSLSVVGRQKIADRWLKALIDIGYAIRKAKPNDIRFILNSKIVQSVDGEEQAKLFRIALELSKIDEYLGGNFSKINLVKLKNYKINVALEQDASSSGAQIIALTTRNKQLAELSNVIPTNQKKRLYDEIATLTFNDSRFKELNKRLGLTEKDLRKASKAQNMVTFYGAGEKTGAMNVEAKLSKALGKKEELFVIKASDRDTVLNEISARMARYEKLDQSMHLELKALREDVKDIFNKGMPLSDDIVEQLYFLDSKTRDLVEKMSRNQLETVSPDDFTAIAKIMSEHLREQVPILKDFTKYFGRLAEAFLTNAKPKDSAFDYSKIIETALFGAKKNGVKLPSTLNRILAIKDESLRQKFLKRYQLWDNESLLDTVLLGTTSPAYRRTGTKIGKFSIFGEDLVKGVEVAFPNKLPKTWTQLPWVNFDGKILEQHFTLSFEEKLLYKTKEGKWITNLLQINQKTDPTWWDEFRNKSDKINEIVDIQKAKTAYAVNGNHSNDATIVKQFHMWGADNKISTSTVHDAFMTNAADMILARDALREIYARTLRRNVIEELLEEMYKRGLPRYIYNQYKKEAIELGLIPVVGQSRINGKLVTENDILTIEDILEKVDHNFDKNRYFYGIG